jgi:hypothetical protein
MIALLINVMIVYFLFISLFGDNKDKAHSIIIFLSCLVFALNPLAAATNAAQHVANKEHYQLYDAATALILCLTFNLDRTSYKHAFLLFFALTCHNMVILHIITKSYFLWWLSFPFYLHYKKLIIMVCILQMVVSINGLRGAGVNAHRILQIVLHRLRLINSYTCKNIYAHKKREAEG